MAFTLAHRIALDLLALGLGGPTTIPNLKRTLGAKTRETFPLFFSAQNAWKVFLASAWREFKESYHANDNFVAISRPAPNFLSVTDIQILLQYPPWKATGSGIYWQEKRTLQGAILEEIPFVFRYILYLASCNSLHLLDMKLKHQEGSVPTPQDFDDYVSFD